MDATEVLLRLTPDQAHEVTRIRDELQAMSRGEERMDEDRCCYLGGKRERTRLLGEQLNGIGGFPLMQVIYDSITFANPCDGRELDVAWHGIGAWQG